MPAQIIDGKALAAARRESLRPDIQRVKEKLGRPPGLAVVLIGEHPASLIYVRNKCRACEELEIRVFEHRLAQTSLHELLDLVRRLNEQPDVDGILVQTPLPAGISYDTVVEAMDPAKDADGVHPYNIGRLWAGRPTLVPCTPAGVMDLIASTGVDLTGREAVVVGRSNTVGKPTAALLLQQHCTVTLCHSRTRDLAGHCRRAEILVAAVGKRDSVRGEWIKPGAVVIDVGINREGNKLYGDVEFEAARERAGFITPVPGGVGPMTIAQVLANTVRAALR